MKDGETDGKLRVSQPGRAKAGSVLKETVNGLEIDASIHPFIVDAHSLLTSGLVAGNYCSLSQPSEDKDTETPWTVSYSDHI